MFALRSSSATSAPHSKDWIITLALFYGLSLIVVAPGMFRLVHESTFTRLPSRVQEDKFFMGVFTNLLIIIPTILWPVFLGGFCILFLIC